MDSATTSVRSAGYDRGRRARRDVESQLPSAFVEAWVVVVFAVGLVAGAVFAVPAVLLTWWQIGRFKSGREVSARQLTISRTLRRLTIGSVALMGLTWLVAVAIGLFTGEGGGPSPTMADRSATTRSEAPPVPTTVALETHRDAARSTCEEFGPVEVAVEYGVLPSAEDWEQRAAEAFAEELQDPLATVDVRTEIDSEVERAALEGCLEGFANWRSGQ